MAASRLKDSLGRSPSISSAGRRTNNNEIDNQASTWPCRPASLRVDGHRKLRETPSGPQIGIIRRVLCKVSASKRRRINLFSEIIPLRKCVSFSSRRFFSYSWRLPQDSVVDPPQADETGSSSGHVKDFIKRAREAITAQELNADVVEYYLLPSSAIGSEVFQMLPGDSKTVSK